MCPTLKGKSWPLRRRTDFSLREWQSEKEKYRNYIDSLQPRIWGLRVPQESFATSRLTEQHMCRVVRASESKRERVRKRERERQSEDSTNSHRDGLTFDDGHLSVCLSRSGCCRVYVPLVRELKCQVSDTLTVVITVVKACQSHVWGIRGHSSRGITAARQSHDLIGGTPVTWLSLSLPRLHSSSPFLPSAFLTHLIGRWLVFEEFPRRWWNLLEGGPQKHTVHTQTLE